VTHSVMTAFDESCNSVDEYRWK